MGNVPLLMSHSAYRVKGEETESVMLARGIREPAVHDLGVHSIHLLVRE